jgi:membrane-associated phospholipid phosphatase
MIDLVIVGLLKVIFRRSRPHLNTQSDMVYGTNSGPDKFSFPSGHSSRAILIANLVYFIIAQHVKNSSIISFLTFLLLNLCSYCTCLSRLLLLRHHLSDVLVGIFVGYFIYFLIVYHLI